MTLVFIEHDTKVATWRTLWPARELRRRGYDVDIYATGAPRPKVEATKDVTYIFHVVNKAWNFQGHIVTCADICMQAREFGRLVVSYDDDWTHMLDIQPKPIHPLTRAVHQQIPELTRKADKVIVATPRLAEVFGRWNEVDVVPNCVPSWMLDMPRPPRLERVAWMGEMYLHGLDWNLLQPYAADLPPLRLVGSGQYAAEKIRSWGAKDVDYTDPILDQRRLYREIGRAVAAIVPLADTPFNRGKSWSKPLEFMARGVQPLASTHAEYARLNELTGALPTFQRPEELVAATVEAWERRPDGDGLPDRLRSVGLTMEQAGGDAWEKALA